MAKNYDTERQGQIEFFENYGIPYDTDDSILADNTDGVYNGVLMEFKLNISSPNKVLLQAIKYLSRLRVKGESVPATILLIDLNKQIAYRYNSEDYREHIQKVYVGAASKGNEGFTAAPPLETIAYSQAVDSARVKKILKGKKQESDKYMPVDIDEGCIVGWAERYYRENPKASKGDFLGDDTGVSVSITGEIRDPKHFKGLIRPYTGKSNEKFKYLMDCLNDRLSKKNLGAFYTLVPYAKKAAELVEMAVQRALDAGKKDYIILDRCAGTGNLEAALIGLTDVNGDDLISHCVVSTFEYYEYKVLNERIGELVRDIIPPTEADVKYANGKVSNADAMSEEYINNPLIKQYVDNPKCSIILFENPPFHDETASLSDGDGTRSGKAQSFILEQMKMTLHGTVTNELAHRFIWSGFRYYIRQDNDCYIVFSPIKYWKQYSFVNHDCLGAFAFNRAHFHATPSTIICAAWGFAVNDKFDDLVCDAYNICDSKLSLEATIHISHVKTIGSSRYTKHKFSDTDLCSVTCEKNGVENSRLAVRIKSYYNNDVIGYMEADSYSIAPLNRNLVRLCLYNGNGCYLTPADYLSTLPLWVAKQIPLDYWYEKDIFATTADGGDAYTKDNDFLKSCLIYTCLSNQNKCLTFDGSDGRHYQNELCFDNGTVASADLEKMQLDDDEKELLILWNRILAEARATGNCNDGWTYGVYQIAKEINTSHKEGSGKQEKTVYDYPQLNGDLDSLRVKLKEYYKSHITDKMFKYELIK